MARKIKGITIEIGGDVRPLNKALEEVNKKSRDLRGELRQVERLLKLDPKNTELLAQKQKILTDAVAQTKDKLDVLREAQKQVQEQFERGEIGEEQYRALQREIIQTEQDLKKLEQRLKEVEKQTSSWTYKLDEAGKKLQRAGKKMVDVGKDLSLKVTTPVVALGTAAGKAAIDFESAFAGVRKTVDASESDLKKLETGIRDMAKEIPAAATEIAGVAEAAGQLGIEVPNILSFTRTMIDLGEATNLSAEEAATSLARLANITQMPQDQFDRLGSTIVALGNNLATTEAEIVEMGLRLAGAGAQVGMTEAQILGFAGALSSVGIAAEAGGSAFSKLMVDMQMAVETGGERMNEFAKVAGMSASEFQKAFKEDAAGAIIAFIQGLGDAEKQGKSAIAILDEMGITEVRMRDALLRAAGASDVFTDALELGTEAWEENTALTKEAEERYKTTEAQLDILRNNVVDLAISLGEHLLPHINKAVENLKKMTERFSQLSPGMQQAIILIAGIGAAIGPALIMFGMMAQGAGACARSVSKAARIISKASDTAAMKSVKNGLKVIANWVKMGAQAMLNAARIAAAWLISLGPIAVVIALVVGAAALIIANWEKVKEFLINFWETVKETFSNAVTAIIEFVTNLWETIKQAFFDAIQAIIEFFQQLPQTLSKFFLEDLPYWLGYALGTVIKWIADVVKWFASLPGKIWTWLKDTIQKIKDWAVETGRNAVQAGEDFVNKVIDYIKQLPSKVWSWLKETVIKIVNWHTETRQKAIEAGKTFVENIITFVKELPGKVWNWLTNTISKIISFASQARTNARTAGQNIIDGIINFIKDLPDKIWNILKKAGRKVLSIGSTFYNNAKKVASNLWEGFKKGLGISSPSYIERAMDAIAERGEALKEQLGQTFRGSLVNDLSSAMDGLRSIPANSAKHMTQVFSGVSSTLQPTPAITAGAGGEILITGNTFYVRNDQDIKLIAKELYNLQQQKARGLGRR